MFSLLFILCFVWVNWHLCYLCLSLNKLLFHLSEKLLLHFFEHSAHTYSRPAQHHNLMGNVDFPSALCSPFSSLTKSRLNIIRWAAALIPKLAADVVFFTPFWEFSSPSPWLRAPPFGHHRTKGPDINQSCRGKPISDFRNKRKKNM